MIQKKINSQPNLCKFDPSIIASQWQAIMLLRKKYDYTQGPAEVLLSGSLGSAKSIILAHLAVTHCIQFPRARFLIGRKAMPDIKSTLYQKIREHIAVDMVEEKHYHAIDTLGKIEFLNGSEIISRSWHDRNYKKFRSLEVSAAAIEELTENDDKDKEFYTELVGRIGRIPWIASKEAFIICATNPDSPSHWAYDYFIKGSEEKKNRFVIYSRTSDNPFLPDWYEESLRDKYDSKMIERLIEGRWVYIDSDSVYYEYNRDKHFILTDTKPDPSLDLHISYDFNIGEGKPMSCCLLQYNKNTDCFTVIDEIILSSSRTLDTLEDLASKGYFDIKGNPTIIINGDASGRSRDTRNIKTDYDIIKDYLANYTRKDRQRLKFEIDVPLSNPPIRKRHNIVNGCLQNSKGRVRIVIDKRCKTLDEGLLKVKLLSKGSYIEDDRNHYQHITTSLGYAVVRIVEKESRPVTQSVQI